MPSLNHSPVKNTQPTDDHAEVVHVESNEETATTAAPNTGETEPTASQTAEREPPRPAQNMSQLDLEAMQLELAVMSAKTDELIPMLHELVKDTSSKQVTDPKTGKLYEKHVTTKGMELIARVHMYRMEMDKINLRNQLKLIEEVSLLRKQIRKDIKEVKTVASRQVVANPNTYASMAARGTETDNVLPPQQINAKTVTVVNTNEILRKQKRAEEKCNKEVVVDLKRILPEEAPETEKFDGEALNRELTRIDPEMSLSDLHHHVILEKHREKPFLVQFQTVEGAKRMLKAAQKAGYDYKALRPSRTKEQRDAHVAKKNARSTPAQETASVAGPTAEKLDKPKRFYYHPKPVNKKDQKMQQGPQPSNNKEASPNGEQA